MAFDLVARLRLKDEMSDGLRKAAGEGDKLKRSLDGVSTTTTRMSRSASTASSAFSRMGSIGGHALGGIGSAAKGVLGAVTSLQSAIIASGVIYAGIIKPLKLASDAEQANIAFTTMLHSADKAKAFLSDLSKFAADTPFELPALRDSSKRLLAFGFASKDIIPMMTGIGNAAAGLGLGADGIDRIATALGQMKQKGKVQGDDALQLLEAGVPVWDILAKKMNKTTAEVIKLSSKGLIPADKAINVLIDGMNERFPGMLEAQSKSLGGLYSTIKDTFNSQILTKWGEGIANGIRPGIQHLTDWINANGATIDRWGKRLQDVATTGSSWVRTKFEAAFKYVKGLIDDPKFSKLPFGDKINVVLDDMKTKFDAWFNSKGNAMISSAAENLASTMRTVLGSQDNIEKMAEIGVNLGKSILSGIGKGIKEDALPSFKWDDKPKSWSDLGHLLLHGGSDSKKSEPAGLTLNSYAPPSSNSPFQPRQIQLPKNAGGIDRVPYNGYRTILHKDERVQTKGEADAMRSGNGRGGVNITVQTMNVRKESDIHDVALQLVQLMQQSEGAYSVG